MTNRISCKRLAVLAALGMLASTPALAFGRGGGGSNGGGDSWLRGELQNPHFVQPGGFAAPNRYEPRPFYGYGYPYTPYADPRLVIRAYPRRAYGW